MKTTFTMIGGLLLAAPLHATDSLVAFYVYQSPSSHHFAPFPPDITIFQDKAPVGSLPIQFDTINSFHLYTLDRTNNNYTIGLHHDERHTTQAWSCPTIPLAVASLASSKLTKLYCTSIAVMDNERDNETSLLTTALNLIKGTTLIAFTLCVGLYVYRRDPFRCQTKGKLRRRPQTQQTQPSQQRAQTPPRRKKKKKLGTPSNAYTSRQLFPNGVDQDQDQDDQDQYDDRLIPDERTLKSPGKFSTCKSVQY